MIPNGYNVSEGGYPRHPMGLSSINDVSSIIYLLKNTNMSNIEIGSLFSVSDQTISDINNGRIWINDSLEYPIRKRKVAQKSYCNVCGRELSKDAKNNLCRKCTDENRKKDVQVSKDELYDLLCHNSFVSVGNMFGVSDNAVRKWCDKYNIPKHSKHYKKSVY